MKDLSSEFVFKTSRSSGPGGQNVNKVNTKVELRFNIKSSQLLTHEEKELLLLKLSKKINLVSEIIVVSQSERTQLKNKEKTIFKFYKIIEEAFKVQKERKPKKTSKAAKEKRLENKKRLSLRKIFRKKIKNNEIN